MLNKVEIHASILMKEKGGKAETDKETHTERKKHEKVLLQKAKYCKQKERWLSIINKVPTLIRKKLIKESLLTKPPYKILFFNYKENNANFTVEKFDRKLFNQVINVTSP